MYKKINLSQFRDAFHDMGRGEQFSYEALEIIYEYLEQSEPECELDVIAICCEFQEEPWLDVIDHYDIQDCDENEEGLNGLDDTLKNKIRTYLNDNTSVIGETFDTVIYIQF